MAEEAKPHEKERALCEDGKYELFISDPKTPKEEFMNDIYISLQQMKAGDVGDIDDLLRELREEHGLNANESRTD